MQTEANDQNNAKAVYEKPELEDHGSLAEHTDSFVNGPGGSDFGSS